MFFEGFVHFFHGNKEATARLRDGDASATNALDLLLGLARKELGLDNHGLRGETTLAQNLVDTLQRKIHHVRQTAKHDSETTAHQTNVHERRKKK